MTSICAVIPLHNKARHIARALDSVLRQTVVPAEIIVVDDASTDGGAEIASRYPGVTMLARTQPGPGGYAARNLAITSATSDYIAFLDADDEWDPGHLETMVGMIERSPADAAMFGTGYDERHPDGRVIKDVYRRSGAGEKVLDLSDFVTAWLDCGECPVWTSAIVAKRSALLDAGLFPEQRCRRGGDKDLWLRLAKQGPVHIQPVPSAIYYKDSQNMVTARPHDNICHCIIDTILDLKKTEPAPMRRLLTRLSNHESFLYALRTAKSQQVRRSTWKHFDPWYNPFQFAILLAISTPLYQPVAQLGVRVKKWTS